MIIRQESGFLGNAGKAAAAFGEQTKGIRRDAMALARMRDDKERRDLESMRQIQQRSMRNDQWERGFALQQERFKAGQTDAEESRAIRQQQQDRLDSQAYGMDLETGMLPITGESIERMVAASEAIQPGSRAQFNEQFNQTTAGEFEAAGINAAAYGDARFLRPTYKSAAFMLGQLEDQQDSLAQTAVPEKVLGTMAKRNPAFLDLTVGGEWAAEVKKAFSSPDYDMSAAQAEIVGKQMSSKGTMLEMREKVRSDKIATVDGWFTNPPTELEGTPLQNVEGIWELVDNVYKSNDPQAAFEAIERRVMPKQRNAARVAVEEERQKAATRDLLRDVRRQRAAATPEQRAWADRAFDAFGGNLGGGDPGMARPGSNIAAALKDDSPRPFADWVRAQGLDFAEVRALNESDFAALGRRYEKEKAEAEKAKASRSYDIPSVGSPPGPF